MDSSDSHLLLKFTISLLRIFHLCERVNILVEPHILGIHQCGWSLATRCTSGYLERLWGLLFCQILHVYYTTTLVKERGFAALRRRIRRFSACPCCTLKRILEKPLKVASPSLGMDVFFIRNLVVNVGNGWSLGFTVLLMIRAQLRI